MSGRGAEESEDGRDGVRVDVLCCVVFCCVCRYISTLVNWGSSPPFLQTGVELVNHTQGI